MPLVCIVQCETEEGRRRGGNTNEDSGTVGLPVNISVGATLDREMQSECNQHHIKQRDPRLMLTLIIYRHAQAPLQSSRPSIRIASLLLVCSLLRALASHPSLHSSISPSPSLPSRPSSAALLSPSPSRMSSTLFGTKAIQAILANKKSWADSQTTHAHSATTGAQHAWN